MFTNLFSSQSSQQKSSISTVQSKRQNHRKQIRRQHYHSRFEQVRKNLLLQLNSQILMNLISAVDSQKQNKWELAQSYFDQVVCILKEHNGEAQFNCRLSEYKLQNFIVGLLLNHKLNQEEKQHLMKSLVLLTFFSDQSSESMMDNSDFLDFIFKQINEASIETVEMIEYLNQIVNLLVNLSSLLNKDFNNFIAESDLSRIMNVKVALTINILNKGADKVYESAVYDLRHSLLRLYKNVIQGNQGSVKLSAQLLSQVFQNQYFVLEHQEIIFQLLTEGLKSQGFWDCFIFHQNSHNSYPLALTIDKLQARCMKTSYLNDPNDDLTDYEFKVFGAFLQFLNQVHGENVSTEDWFTLIQNSLNGYMLADYIFKAHRKNIRSAVIQSLRMFKNLAESDDIYAYQILITREFYPKNALLRIFADPQLMKGSLTSSYCLRILCKLIEKDVSLWKPIYSYRVIDSIQSIFLDTSDSDILSHALNLAYKMVEHEQKNESNEGSLLNVFQNRGILKKVEILQDHNNRQLSEHAERLMNIATKQSSNC